MDRGINRYCCNKGDDMSKGFRLMFVVGEDWVHFEFYKYNFKIPFIVMSSKWWGEWGFLFYKNYFNISKGHEARARDYLLRKY